MHTIPLGWPRNCKNFAELHHFMVLQHIIIFEWVMGMSCSLGIWGQFADFIRQKLPNKDRYRIIMDDILIFSKKDTHQQDIEDLLDVLIEYGLRISLHKCQIFRDQLVYMVLHFMKKCSQYRRDSRKLWRLINELIRKSGNKKNTIESLKIKNLMKYDPDSITTEFCEFFSTVGEKFAKGIKPPQDSIDHYLNKMPKSDKSLFLAPTSVDEIHYLIKSLPNKTSSGHDSISQ